MEDLFKLYLFKVIELGLFIGLYIEKFIVCIGKCVDLGNAFI